MPQADHGLSASGADVWSIRLLCSLASRMWKARKEVQVVVDGRPRLHWLTAGQVASRLHSMVQIAVAQCVFRQR